MQLKAGLILKTIGRLEQRIQERFPDSGLSRVCGKFRVLAQEAEALARKLTPPIWPVRIDAWMAALLLPGLVIWAFVQLVEHFSFNAEGLNAVNDFESLTQGMAAKIWQKIMILDLSEE